LYKRDSCQLVGGPWNCKVGVWSYWHTNAL